ncbi:MAG: NEW3 domain-containing protein [Acidobacteriota bacterium]
MRAETKRLIILIFLAAIAAALFSQSTVAQREDEQRRFLEVRRRQIELQAARRQLERSEKLAREGLLSQSDVERDRAQVANAQLNYQQAVLALFDIQPRISIRSAIKSQTADGRKMVRLVIANLTPAFDDSQFKLLSNFDGADPIPEELKTRAVNDIFVSLRDSAPSRSATISLPYEVHIAQMKYNESKTIDYQLLKDVDTVTVALTYRNQTQEIPVQLQHSSGEAEIQIISSQFSQEADLGSQATYTITLERPSVDVRSFQLKAVNLPRQISYSFIDLQSQARLSQINFPAGITRQELGLRLFLPERADEQVRVDRAMQFWALALDSTSAARFSEDRIYSEADLGSAGSGKAKLVIIPRGVGRIEVTAATLFSEIEIGQMVETAITIRNTGTRRLDNIRLAAEYPLNWRVEVAPDIIPALEMNREEAVSLKLFPPADASVGDYEARIKTESFADNRRVQTEDKIYRVSLKPGSNVWSTAALIGGLLALVAGVVTFGIRMARR